MKKFIIAIAATLMALTAQASWDVSVRVSEMTDQVDRYTLSTVAEGDANGRFALNCYDNGSENMFFFAGDYIGLTTVSVTQYAVDGKLFSVIPHYKRLRVDHFATAADFNSTIVAAMSIGHDLRIRQTADYDNSKVYRFSLKGFTDAYAKWGALCSEFY